MEDKAAVLERQGQQFHSNAVKLRRKFCMQSYRLGFLIFLILAVSANTYHQPTNHILSEPTDSWHNL
jgi:hypothetical protein